MRLATTPAGVADRGVSHFILKSEEFMNTRVPEFTLEVSVASIVPDGKGGQVMKQKVTVAEYSDTPQEHIYKNMEIASGVLGVFGQMAAGAVEALNKGVTTGPWEVKKTA